MKNGKSRLHMQVRFNSQYCLVFLCTLFFQRAKITYLHPLERPSFELHTRLFSHSTKEKVEFLLLQLWLKALDTIGNTQNNC